MLSIALVSVLVLGALWSTAQLIDDLVHGSPQTNSASDLLEAGSIVWLSNTIAFALLYWELDGGGAAARALEPRPHPDLAFPQQLNPASGHAIGARGSSTTSTSVSPTRWPSARPT